MCNGICGDYIIALAEKCDNGPDVPGDCCDPTCQFEPTSYSCRASAGVCDAAEYCLGTSAFCPTDAKLPNTTLCSSPATACNPAEYCTGYTNNCPPDVYTLNGTVCSPYLAFNFFQLILFSSTTCFYNATCQGGFCIDGLDVYCHGVCGDHIVASLEDCDPPVNANATCCSNCHFVPSSTICRNSTGICYPADYCTGLSQYCPPANHSCPICINNCTGTGYGLCIANGVCECEEGHTGIDCSIRTL